MKENTDLYHSQSSLIYAVSLENWCILLLAFLYLILSVLSICWILRNSIMNPFQKAIHILLTLMLPLFWIYFLRMIYKPIPGYVKSRWTDGAADGNSGGHDGFVSGGGCGDGGGD